MTNYNIIYFFVSVNKYKLDKLVLCLMVFFVIIIINSYMNKLLCIIIVVVYFSYLGLISWSIVCMSFHTKFASMIIII